VQVRKKQFIRFYETILIDVFNIYTVKPVLGGHLWDNEKWPYKTVDLLKEV
jgi:hypothetical protein